MGKNKKKLAKPAAPTPGPAADEALATPAEPTPDQPDAPEGAETPSAPRQEAPAAQAQPPRSRLRLLLPDLVKAAAALAVIAAGAVIWYQPPLIRATRPAVSYRFQGQSFSDAALYRPLAMPTRYYIQLPRQLAGRYTWFAVDRRREVAALADAPQHRLLGRSAIKRGDPLGLDLEFRKLDRSEWQVHFLPDEIVFSNAVLTVRLDAEPDNTTGDN
jgi:hypothetical protein